MANETIKTTLGALISAQPALDRLLALPMSHKASYHLAKLGRLVRAELKAYNTQRETLIREFGHEREPLAHEKAANPALATLFEVKAENTKAFNARLEVLTAEPVEIAWRAFNLADIGPAFVIAAEDLIALDDLVLPAEDETKA